MAELSLSGVYTALVTPFVKDGSGIDWAAFEKLVSSQLEGGVSGLVPCGTTGEAPTLTESEQREVIARTVALAKGRVPVLAGTGSNSTAKTIEASKTALEAGADGVMIVMPYYSKPSQEGMIQHCKLVATAVGAPVVVYNVPGRTVADLTVQSLLRVLEACPNVIGLKDASGNVLYCQDLLRQAGDRIAVLCGDDALTLPMMSVGARGVISVTSNVLPKPVSDQVRSAEKGDYAEARRAHLRLVPVHKVMFYEPSPQPIKAALALRGMMSASVRPPLIEASEQCRAAVAQALRTFEAV